MKELIVIAVALLIMGSLGLWLGSTLTYIPEQEALTYIEAKPQKWMLYQSVNQQQFNLMSGAISFTLGLAVLISIGVLRIIER